MNNTHHTDIEDDEEGDYDGPADSHWVDIAPWNPAPWGDTDEEVLLG